MVIKNIRLFYAQHSDPIIYTQKINFIAGDGKHILNNYWVTSSSIEQYGVLWLKWWAVLFERQNQNLRINI
jgi:hypothetical protein